MLHTFKPNSAGVVRCLSALSMLTAISLPAPADAQQSRLDQLAQRVRDFRTVFEAYEYQTDLCQGYIGQTITVTPYATLAENLFTSPVQGEFETGEQYDARLNAVAARAPSGPIVLELPTDRDFVTYYPDRNGGPGSMMIRVGAFGAVPYLDDVELDVMEMSATSVPLSNGTRVLHSVTDRPIRTYVSRNGLGTSVTVSEVERNASFVYSAQRLFPHAADSQTAILVVEVGLAEAPSLMQNLRVALAVVPRAPYVLKDERDGSAPTMRNPVQNRYKLTNLYVDAKCGLVLDSQSRVLNAVNAGS